MKRHRFTGFRGNLVLRAFCILLLTASAPSCPALEPSTAAVAAFDAYVRSVESRLAQQHGSPSGLLALAASDSRSEARPRPGEPVSGEPIHREPIIEQLTPSAGIELPGATLYHWRGTAFAPGAQAADFERLMKDFNSYPRNFSPQVVEARVLTQDADHMQATMQIRQQHIITVVLDTTYDISFHRLDATHGYSVSRSTHIAEVASPGTHAEHVLSASQEHGFLWRQNIYWSYEQRDGGLYMQIESISLTRSIPTGLGWAIGPYVESIPRESLEFTLRATCNALREERSTAPHRTSRPNAAGGPAPEGSNRK
jgi:hypothetical protein